MRQYWINFKGKQEGPMSIEKMVQMGVDETAYVWHSGLPDWVKITRVPELAEMLENAKNSKADDAQPQQAITEPQPEQTTQEATNVAAETAPQEPVSVPPSINGLNQTPARAQQIESKQQHEEVPKCPPTNMAWAIITTLLCCTPAGIVGIIFAFLTKKNYRNGEYERANKMSEWGAWAIIASIILGLIATPLACASHFGQM